MDNKNKGFFGIIISSKILDVPELTLTDCAVYGYITSYSSKVCYDSNEWIASKLKISKRSVQYALTNLQKCGCIVVVDGNSKKRKIYDTFGKPHKFRVLSNQLIIESNMRNVNGGKI